MYKICKIYTSDLYNLYINFVVLTLFGRQSSMKREIFEIIYNLYIFYAH